jgi:insulysin
MSTGTEKYPDESSYKKFLSAHGGAGNASTSMERTTFHFELRQEHLDPILDRFAQFFTAPLFTESATDRELNAVHAEHSKNVQTDARRLFQLLKSTCNPQHPFFKFGTGNKTTLGETPISQGRNVRAELLAFHAAHYTAPVPAGCRLLYFTHVFDSLG